MPIFEFKCDKCDIVVEEFMRSSKKAKPVCPDCGGEMHKLVSSPGSVIFKGTGYYTTDYGKSKIFKDIEKKESDKSKESKTEKKAKTPKPVKKVD